MHVIATRAPGIAAWPGSRSWWSVRSSMIWDMRGLPYLVAPPDVGMGVNQPEHGGPNGPGQRAVPTIGRYRLSTTALRTGVDDSRCRSARPVSSAGASWARGPRRGHRRPAAGSLRRPRARTPRTRGGCGTTAIGGGTLISLGGETSTVFVLSATEGCTGCTGTAEVLVAAGSSPA